MKMIRWILKIKMSNLISNILEPDSTQQTSWLFPLVCLIPSSICYWEEHTTVKTSWKTCSYLIRETVRGRAKVSSSLSSQPLHDVSCSPLQCWQNFWCVFAGSDRCVCLLWSGGLCGEFCPDGEVSPNQGKQMKTTTSMIPCYFAMSHYNLPV